MLCFLMDCLDENVLNLSIYILARQEKQPYLCPIILNELNEFFMKRLFQLIVLCMLGLFMLPSSIWAARDKEKVPLDGDWNIEKSLNPMYPISAFLDASTLTIQSTDRFSDITVRISGAEGIVYEATYPAENSACIVIDLDSSLRGEYTLELTNQWGCYLVGVFEL